MVIFQHAQIISSINLQNILEHQVTTFSFIESGRRELKILLLYAREEGDFQGAVHDFRQNLQNELDCEVRKLI
jgi:hypothetical protein